MSATSELPALADRDPAGPTLVVQVAHSSALLLVRTALRTGVLGRVGRTVLLHSSRAAVPEAGRVLTETVGWEAFSADFDLVLDYDELVSPYHPLAWTPATPAELVPWAATLRERVSAGSAPVRLLLNDLHLAPARTLAVTFPEAEIDVYAEDLSAWSASPTVLEPGIGSRVRQLVHADLWPGLAPRLLSETARTATALSPAELRRTAGELPGNPLTPGPPVGVVVEEDLAGLGLSEDQAAALAAEQIATAHRHGAERVLVVRDPVPALGSESDLLVEAGAEELDADEVPLAALLRTRPVVVVGCCSPLLFSSGVLAVAVQPTDVLHGLQPWAHPARVPLALADLRFGPSADPAGTAASLPARADHFAAQRLVDALAHAVQPSTHRRFAAQSRLLTEQQPDLAARYYRPGNPLARPTAAG